LSYHQCQVTNSLIYAVQSYHAEIDSYKQCTFI